MEIIAEGLAFPEGPVIMADGSVIVVEIMGGRVTRCWNGRTETVCLIGGGPNGAAIGPDGALWICNNGGLGETGPAAQGRIERVDLATGRFERVYDNCDGIALEGPNDLVFDKSGRMWFTDLGKHLGAVKTASGLFTCQHDGSSITALNRNATAYNGVGLSPDGQRLYVADTTQARIYRYDARVEAQKPTFIANVTGPVGLDSLAITAAGNICAATLYEGAISTVTPDGKVTRHPIPDERFVTNIAFGGADMRDAWITLSSQGRLVRLRWDEPGLELAFNC
jgi:gluconolactonase